MEAPYDPDSFSVVALDVGNTNASFSGDAYINEMGINAKGWVVYPWPEVA
jgi:hypothetical protein